MLISKYGNGTASQVEEFENKYGIKLDGEYKLFLIKYNGGDTPNTSFKSGKHSETVKCLFGINSKRNIEDYNEYFDFKKNECIPIGMDNFGNYYAIGISHEDNGAFKIVAQIGATILTSSFFKTRLSNAIFRSAAKSRFHCFQKLKFLKTVKMYRAIFFCNHEKGFGKEKISDSFKEFIHKCKSEPIDDFAKKSPEEMEKMMIEKGRGNVITETLRTAWKKQYEKYKDMMQEEVTF